MADRTYWQTLKQPGVPSFMWTQFLGAFNDNLFKIVVSLVAVHAASGSSGGSELSIVGAVFILPFLLFSGYAGQVADIRSKRTVLVSCKLLEIVAMCLGLAAFIVGRLEITYGVLFLMAIHSTFFSPAKYGILTEILPEQDLSRANGVLEMSTFVAIVAGTAFGGFMFDIWADRLWLIGLVVTAVAVVGAVASLGIPRVAPAAPERRMDVNPWSEIVLGTKRLWHDRVLWPTVMGLSYFWFLGALLQLVMILFGKNLMGLDDSWVGILTTFAAIGIGVGSMAAGRLSGDKVELGLAPLGAIGMGLFAILLSTSAHSFALAAVALTCVGFFGGLFAVPLNALLQHRSGERELGRLLATNNFINMVGVLLASGSLALLDSVLGWSPARIVLVFGVLTLVASVYVLLRVPEFSVRFTLWLLTHTIYRIRIVGQEHVPAKGPALLVCNHVSLADGALVGACIQRFVRFMVYKPFYEHWSLHWLFRLMHAIPLAPGRDALASLDTARRELEAGHVVCIFAEGSITRTGNLLPFKRGFERIVSGLDVPIVPVYLDRVWGSIFSYKGERFFWKRPARIPYPVTVAFGAPLKASATPAEVRLAVMTLGSTVIAERPTRELLADRFIRTAKSRWSSFCMADASRALKYGEALVGARLLASWIRVHGRDEPCIALLLPASVGGALANLAVTLAGKTAVNVNFTSGREAMTVAMDRCGIKTIVTSRPFISKADIPLDARMVFLEDIVKEFGPGAKLRAWLTSRLLPSAMVARMTAGRRSVDRPAAIVFSSGSTGMPKGVVLTHANIIANVEGVRQIFPLGRTDVIMGALPFFHSFGFTGTLWLPMLAGLGVAYHPNPTEAKAVGDLAERYGVTTLISTPTFCNTYVRKIRPEQFAKLRYAIVGAERLRESIATAFVEKFGVPLLEGYGCTEMAPVVAVNRPDVAEPGGKQRGNRPSTVGHPLPGVVAKIVDPATGDGPLFGQEGLLLLNGPNRMAGYLGDEERTHEALRDGWYVTGDIAAIDEDGFIRITDRLSRFSKIGGEMVPHVKIEDLVNDLLSEPHFSVVTAVPDDVRGERLVVLFTDPNVDAPALWEHLCQTELPRLWLPKREDILFVAEIPTLGTGKADLRAVKQMAMERA